MSNIFISTSLLEFSHLHIMSWNKHMQTCNSNLDTSRHIPTTCDDCTVSPPQKIITQSHLWARVKWLECRDRNHIGWNINEGERKPYAGDFHEQRGQESQQKSLASLDHAPRSTTAVMHLLCTEHLDTGGGNISFCSLPLKGMAWAPIKRLLNEPLLSVAFTCS